MIAHRNNFGLLRLIFASLVIVGHAPEMIDGNGSRELLFTLTNTLTLGGLAVTAFFLLSGYLITSSMLHTNDLSRYLQKRIVRICPAFVVAFLLSTFVLGPWVGAQILPQLPETFGRMILLEPPIAYKGQFPGMSAYPILNGAMWTIAYEFRCYILIAILWKAGLLADRPKTMVLTLATLILFAFLQIHGVAWRLQELGKWAIIRWVGGNDVTEAVRFAATFLVGTSIFLFRATLLPRLTGRAASFAVVVGVLCILNPRLAKVSLVIFGAVPLFWLALRANLGRLQKINDKWDISYGTYLYGWPIAMALRWSLPDITPVQLAGITLPLALLAGCASWWGLEKWIKVGSTPKKNGLPPSQAA